MLEIQYFVGYLTLPICPLIVDPYLSEKRNIRRVSLQEMCKTPRRRKAFKTVLNFVWQWCEVTTSHHCATVTS